ncbi:beta-lactamase [Pycnococcus provasolii]
MAACSFGMPLRLPLRRRLRGLRVLRPIPATASGVSIPYKNSAFFLFLLVLLSGLLACSRIGFADALTETRDSGASASPDSELDSLLLLELSRTTTAAACAAVVTTDGTLAQGKAGRVAANDFDANDVTSTSRWHIGSLTKAMTAALVSVLEFEGYLSWSDKLSRFVPEAADSTFHDVTLKDLANHAAGFPLHPEPDGWWQVHADCCDVPLPTSGPPYEKAFVRCAHPEHTPRSLATCREHVTATSLKATRNVTATFRYSNVGYVVLAQAASAAVAARKTIGTPPLWEELIASHLWAPMGIQAGVDCGFGPAEGSHDPFAHLAPNGTNASAWIAMRHDFPPIIGPAGNVHCTPAAMARYLQWTLRGLRMGKYGSLASDTFPSGGPVVRDFRWRSLLTEGVKGDRYMLGWRVSNETIAGGLTLHHVGTNYLNYASVELYAHAGVAVFTAASDYPTGKRVVNSVHWALKERYLACARAGAEGGRAACAAAGSACDWSDPFAKLRLQLLHANRNSLPLYEGSGAAWGRGSCPAGDNAVAEGSAYDRGAPHRAVVVDGSCEKAAVVTDQRSPCVAASKATAKLLESMSASEYVGHRVVDWATYRINDRPASDLSQSNGFLCDGEYALSLCVPEPPTPPPPPPPPQSPPPPPPPPPPSPPPSPPPPPQPPSPPPPSPPPPSPPPSPPPPPPPPWLPPPPSPPPSPPPPPPPPPSPPPPLPPQPPPPSSSMNIQDKRQMSDAAQVSIAPSSGDKKADLDLALGATGAAAALALFSCAVCWRWIIARRNKTLPEEGGEDVSLPPGFLEIPAAPLALEVLVSPRDSASPKIVSLTSSPTTKVPVMILTSSPKKEARESGDGSDEDDFTYLWASPRTFVRPEGVPVVPLELLEAYGRGGSSDSSPTPRPSPNPAVKAAVEAAVSRLERALVKFDGSLKGESRASEILHELRSTSMLRSNSPMPLWEPRDPEDEEGGTTSGTHSVGSEGETRVVDVSRPESRASSSQSNLPSKKKSPDGSV